MKKFYIKNKYAFLTYIHIYMGSKSSIDINAISIFNNQPCMNHNDMKIIKIKLFVNNVACKINIIIRFNKDS